MRYILPLFLGVLFLSITPFHVVYAQGAVGNLVGAVGSLFSMDFSSLWAWMGNGILQLFGTLVRLGGWLLDSAIQYTVVDMKGFVNGITAIDLSWRVFRDFANIIFIFLLLYAAIATILQISNFQTKQVVTRLVIIALLVNFSLFFTKAIIDVSNITALQFYHAMQVEDPQGDRDLALSEVFMNSLRLTSIYNVKTGDVGVSGSQDILEPNNIGSITIIGSIFFLITAFVFFAGAILFVIRFAILILLMVVAPFAFVAWILPSTEKWFKKWWQTLLKQAFFAPIYLGITYLVVRIITDPTFKQTLYSGGSSLAGEISGFGSGPATVTLAFAFVATLLIATLVIAQNMSLAGSNTVIKWGKSAQRWGRNKIKGGAGRTAGNVVGYTARKADEELAGTGFGNTLIGSKLRDVTTRKAMGVKFGAKQTYAKRREKAVEAKEKRAGARAGLAKEHIEQRADKIAEGYQSQIEGLQNQIAQLQREGASAADIKQVQTQLSELKAQRDREMAQTGENYLQEYEAFWKRSPVTGKRWKGNKMTADKLREYVYGKKAVQPDDKPWEAEDKTSTPRGWRERRGEYKKEKGKKEDASMKQLLEELQKLQGSLKSE